MFNPVNNTLITGVGGLQAHAEGHSDVDVYTMLSGTMHTIHLHDVLYVPGNKNNLFSLG